MFSLLPLIQNKFLMSLCDSRSGAEVFAEGYIAFFPLIIDLPMGRPVALVKHAQQGAYLKGNLG